MATRFYELLFPRYDNHAYTAVFQRLDFQQLHSFVPESSSRQVLPFGIFRSLFGHIDLIVSTILNAFVCRWFVGWGFRNI